MSAAASATARAARRRLLLWGAVAIALSAVLAVAFWPRAVEVELGTVDRGTVREELVDEGRTRMREVYVVAAPVSGRLLRVAVEPGDAVRAGEGVGPVARPLAWLGIHSWGLYVGQMLVHNLVLFALGSWNAFRGGAAAWIYAGLLLGGAIALVVAGERLRIASLRLVAPAR